jgi:hypothetical protein
MTDPDSDPDSQLVSFSKPAATQDSPLLQLPPELRNRIYQFCFEKDYGIAPMRYRYKSLPVSLLRACQGINHEAASTLYSNNVFEFRQEYRRHGHNEEHYIFVSRKLIAFWSTVGSNIVSVRNMVIYMEFREDYANYENEEENGSALIEVTDHLRPIWRANLTEKLQVTFKNRGGFIKDLDAFNKVFRFLQLGSLRVKKYHQMVEEVYIKGDGSGGTILWGPRDCRKDIFLPGVYCDSVEFLATDSGLRLLPQRPEQALQLMTLPADIQYKIYGMVLDQVKIDADKTANPLCPLLYVNQELRMSEDDYLREVSLIEITTSTALTETTFTDFNNLRKLVRKMFDLGLGPYGNHTLANRCRDNTDLKPCNLQFNLHFNVREVVMLEDLRISVLPFIMETSYFSGKTPVTISIFSERAGKMVPGATHRIPLHALRSRVVAALTAMVDLPELNFRRISNVWIDGRGEVVASNIDKLMLDWRGEVVASNTDKFTYGYGKLEMPKFASKIIEHGPQGPYEIADEAVHPLDAAYRGPHWTWKGTCHWYHDQFFPFTYCPNETLKYLQWVVDPESVPKIQRKLSFIW